MTEARHTMTGKLSSPLLLKIAASVAALVAALEFSSRLAAWLFSVRDWAFVRPAGARSPNTLCQMHMSCTTIRDAHTLTDAGLHKGIHSQITNCNFLLLHKDKVCDQMLFV